MCSRAAHLTVPHQVKEQPEEADARLRRVSASSGAAAPLGYVVFFASVEIAVCTPCAGLSSRKARGGITPLALHRVSLGHMSTGIKTAHVHFHLRNRVRTRLSGKNRTQGLTRQNTGLHSDVLWNIGLPPHHLKTAEGSERTPQACVRFLRCRGPAGLRDLIFFLSLGPDESQLIPARSTLWSTPSGNNHSD